MEAGCWIWRLPAAGGLAVVAIWPGLQLPTGHSAPDSGLPSIPCSMMVDHVVPEFSLRMLAAKFMVMDVDCHHKVLYRD